MQGFRGAVNVDKGSGGSAILLYEMPRPTSFGKDTGLQFRMAVTLFLLGAIYVALVVVLFAVGASGITTSACERDFALSHSARTPIAEICRSLAS